jgi:paraquat-inducible protein B
MIKRLLSLAAMLIIGLLVYNTFFGTEQDRESVEKVTSGFKELFQSTKDKYASGEYDEAIDKIGDIFNQLKDKANDLNNNEYNGELSELQQKKERLEELLRELETKENTPTRSLVPENLDKDREQIQQELEALQDDVEVLTKKMFKE